MLSKDDLGALNLDVADIERDLRLNLHFGWQYEEGDDSNEPSPIGEDISDDDEKRINGFPLRFALSASYYRQAAAHSLLLYMPEVRGVIFNQAMRAYARIKVPYAFNMAAFTRESDSFELSQITPFTRERGIVEDTGLSQNLDFQAQFIYALIADVDSNFPYGLRNHNVHSHSDDGIVARLRERLEDYRSIPIGILGIPLKFYLDLVDALDGSFGVRDNNLEEAMLPFITRYDETIKLAIEDEFRWRQIAMDFHPAEPDIFGVLIRLQSILQRRRQGGRLIEFINSLPISRTSRILLRGILADYN